ncbi:uncharacterized protein [Physcomitrium patens]|uniref:HMA domain-containing protein n=1 Tax=Physcomitrium patens TaxID=3218 RepID=A9S8U9_PHYPA|nr:uncharacterized protein LOC112277556 [Physcomitrium patens]PNR27697.1 hypothetical protein PHYPA_029849 [Physcomitrium patens]|eukprot:XP_024365797.1 uncharacterized protein LOC112277556 [Physcomitrella patens]
MSSPYNEVYYGGPIDPLYPPSRLHHPFFDSSIGRPMLPDVQFRVPMETRRDVDKVKDALDIDGVRSVDCDPVTQTVTVSGNVPYHRLLKKLKHVKRRSKLISFIPDHPYSTYNHGSYPVDSTYSSSSYARSYRRPLSPPHLRSNSYVAYPHLERPYYEDYEDYRPHRYGGY